MRKPSGFYKSLISTFPIGSIGKGSETIFEGLSHQPMTYGLLLSAEAHQLKNCKNKESFIRINEALNWLLMNADLDRDGIMGWGLPHAWDAFNDGSVNPENHPYTITTAIVIQGLLDALSVPKLLVGDLRKQIANAIIAVCLYWCKNAWTDIEEGGYFWYSISKSDAYFTPNVSSMFLGILSRILVEQKKALTKKQYRLIQTRVDSAAKAIISNVSLEFGVPFWPYTVTFKEPKKERQNDLVHHGYILWGMEIYRTNHHGHSITWSLQQAIQSMDTFIFENKVYEYPQTIAGKNITTFKRPARLWGTGMLLAFYSKYSTDSKTKQLIEIIDKDYGPFPNLKLYPEYFCKDHNLYPRHTSHVLWGLSFSDFN